MMKADDTPNTARRAAITLSIIVFGFMRVVSAVIVSTDGHLTTVDYFLIMGTAEVSQLQPIPLQDSLRLRKQPLNLLVPACCRRATA
jgi:hypothetical protein